MIDGDFGFDDVMRRHASSAATTPPAWVKSPRSRVVSVGFLFG